VFAPEGALGRVAQQRENTVMAAQAGQDAAGNVTAADDQKFLHCAILPDWDISGEAMGFQVSIEPGRHSFQAESDETILEAALRQGLSLPYGCRNGFCGSCRGKVLTGAVEHGAAPVEVLSNADRAAGFALFCCAMARSDLRIESREVRSFEDIPIRTLPARVQRLTRDGYILGYEARLNPALLLKYSERATLDPFAAVFVYPDGRNRSWDLDTMPPELRRGGPPAVSAWPAGVQVDHLADPG